MDYTSKTIKHNGATITVRRPILDDSEREKKAKEIVEGLGRSLSDYLRRTQ